MKPPNDVSAVRFKGCTVGLSALHEVVLLTFNNSAAGADETAAPLTFYLDEREALELARLLLSCVEELNSDTSLPPKKSMN